MLAGRPLVPLVVVWILTAGHTMNFHEMGGARGWVAAELYSLHTALAITIALTLLACPVLGQLASRRGLTQLGLLLVAAGSFLNGLFMNAPLTFFFVGRVLTGIGAGLVIAFAPRLLDHRWESPTAWASILLPVVGPGVIAAATMVHGWSDWEWGFRIEGAAALFSSLVLFSMRPAPKLPRRARTPDRWRICPGWWSAVRRWSTSCTGDSCTAGWRAARSPSRRRWEAARWPWPWA